MMDASERTLRRNRGTTYSLASALLARILIDTGERKFGTARSLFSNLICGKSASGFQISTAAPCGTVRSIVTIVTLVPTRLRSRRLPHNARCGDGRSPMCEISGHFGLSEASSNMQPVDLEGEQIELPQIGRHPFGHPRSRQFDNRRDAADLNRPSPGAVGTSPSGRRTARPNLWVETFSTALAVALVWWI